MSRGWWILGGAAMVGLAAVAILLALHGGRGGGVPVARGCGVTAELRSVRRVADDPAQPTGMPMPFPASGDRIRVELSATEPIVKGGAIEFDIPEIAPASSPGMMLEQFDSSIIRTPSGEPRYRATATFDVPPHTDRITLRQKVLIRRDRKKPLFEFTGIAPGSMPIRAQKGGATVTLKKLSKGVIDQKRWGACMSYGGWRYHGQACFTIEIDVRTPVGVAEVGHAEIQDEKGTREVGGVFVANSARKTLTRTVPLAMRGPGLAERAANFLRRIPTYAPSGYSTSTTYTNLNGGRLLVFDAKDRPSGPFTVRVRLTLPPDKKDQAVLVFKDVPVQ